MNKKLIKSIIIIIVVSAIGFYLFERTSTEVKKIDETVKSIQNNELGYKQKEVGNEDGALVGSFDGDQLVAVTESRIIEQGTRTVYSFFSEGKLIFVDELYDFFTYDSKTGKYSNETKIVFESKYYLVNGKVIKRIEIGDKNYSPDIGITYNSSDFESMIQFYKNTLAEIGFSLEEENENINYQDKQLIGVWRGPTEENPGFEIKADGVYDADGIPSKYIVDGSGNITIYYHPGFVITGKYKVENNKLYLTSKGNTDIYSRWCPEKKEICS